MSRLFKSSRVILDNEAYVLSSKIEKSESHEELAAQTTEASLEAANQAIAAAKAEANAILEEADKEAETIEKRAQKDSERIVADAYDQAKGILESARQEGYDEGYQKGIDDAEETAAQIVNEALGLRDAWHQEREKLLKDSEVEIVTLVLETVEKVLNKKLDSDEGLIDGLIKAAVMKMTQVTHFTLRVAVEDYNHAVSIKPMILAMTEKIEDIEIRQDASLKQGACIVDSESGSIDSGLWTQYEQIKNVFEDLLRNE
ncbi:MAG: flagellar assembly protein FliH [Clostridiales bacterium]|nr:flagellar assembly protein FliH [Clostridiales bacterium]MDN5299648.1 flagellar assembly protein FliH [Clostridiales bacterium]